MAPSSNVVSAQLRQMILYHLDNNLPDNALFLAGRLQALDTRNADSVHLLATCHARLGQHKAVYQLTKLPVTRGAHVGCSYVFAQACLALKLYTEGIAALEKTRSNWAARSLTGSSKGDMAARRFTPDAAAFFCLLGKLHRLNGEEKRAIDCFTETLKINPFMWDAFEMLCNSSLSIRPSSIFKSSNELLAFLSTDVQRRPNDETSTSKSVHSQASLVNSQISAPTPAAVYDPFGFKAPEDIAQGLRNNAASKLNIGASTANVNSSSWPDTPPSVQNNETSPGASTAVAYTQRPPFDPPAAPVRRSRVAQPFQAESSSHLSDAVRVQSSLSGPSRSRFKAPSDGVEESDFKRQNGQIQHVAHQKRTISGTTYPQYTANDCAAPQRRSNRLLKKDQDSILPPPPIKDIRGELRKVKATGTRGRTANISTVGRVVSGNRKPTDSAEATLKAPGRSASGNSETGASTARQTSIDTTERESLNVLLDLFTKLGLGYYALTKYKCQLALSHFSSLPSLQRETPWVLVQIGKAHYEQNNYIDAEKAFERVRKLDPTRLEDMEVYSTVLWHLKRETQLAYLSHELTELDRLSPQAWACIGNSFALQREHDQALKCFKRATQLDASFAYGFTLQGHEHFENEEYDKAAKAFRTAISVDRRQYNGWYGIGKVYDKQGRTERAEEHFHIAARINPHNSVILVGIGMVLEKQRKHQQALTYYERAVELAPQAKLARFKKARMLVQMKHFDTALHELLQLKDLVPDEPNVHFMLGRVFKRLGDKASALRHYTTAMNLDPKAAGLIKEAMEELDDDMTDEMDEVDDDGQY